MNSTYLFDKTEAQAPVLVVVLLLIISKLV